MSIASTIDFAATQAHAVIQFRGAAGRFVRSNLAAWLVFAFLGLALTPSSTAILAQDAEVPAQPTADVPLETVVEEQESPAANEAKQAAAESIPQRSFKHAMVIDFDGPIFGPEAAYLNNRLDRAKRNRVDLIVIRMTSPGGLMTDSIELAKRIAAIDWATTITYVPNQAISGGAIVALGSDHIYMAPRAMMGDAGPIVMGPNGQFEHAEAKAVSYLASAMRQLADAKGRPTAIAEAMVDRNLKVFRAIDKNSREVRFFTAQESSDPAIADRFETPELVAETGQDRFLTIAGTRAVELKLADATFATEAELFNALKVEQLSQTRMNWIDHTVFLLNRPWLTGLLLLVALVALYIELAAPGISVAGLTSLGCFAVFFWSHALGGTSGWLEVMLFVLGVVCLLVEIFLIPGTGIAGLAGVIFVLISLIMATQDFVLPSTQVQWQQLQKNTLIVLGTISVVGILLVVQLFVFDSLPGLNRFQLSAPSLESAAPTESPANTVATLNLPEIGERGVAESVLRPSGKVLFDTRLVDVVTEGDYLDPGTPVEVIRRDGIRIVVRKC